MNIKQEIETSNKQQERKGGRVIFDASRTFRARYADMTASSRERSLLHLASERNVCITFRKNTQHFVNSDRFIDREQNVE